MSYARCSRLRCYETVEQDDLGFDPTGRKNICDDCLASLEAEEETLRA